MVEEIQSESAGVTGLRSVFDGILALDVDGELVRSADLGSASFEKSRTLFEEIRGYLRGLSALPWGKLTPTMIDKVTGSANALRSVLDTVRGFTLQGNPIAVRDGLETTLASAFDTFKDETVGLVGYLAWQSVKLTDMKADADLLLDGVKKQADATLKTIEERRAEADKALEAIRGASAMTGVAHHAEVFAATGKSHADAAKWWLVSSIVAAVVTVLTGLGLVELWDVKGDISDASVLQLVVVKGVVLTVGFVVTLNLLRMYRSNVHLAVINKHREDSLRTFRAFAEGTDDPETKDKVLLEATHAIFAQTNTGLVDGHDSSDTIELLDGVTGLIRRRT